MSSPTVKRAVSVITFFADHPGKSFRLSDIAEALRISPSTCHVLLKEFVHSGFLFRSSDKAYHLGMAAYRLANAAKDSSSPLRAASSAMRRLADRFDVVCQLVVPEAGRWVIRDSAFSVSHLGWPVAGNAALPDQPPFGAVFKAWAKPQEVEAWLAKSKSMNSKSDRARMTASLALTRELGFSFGFRTVPLHNEAQAQALLYRADQTEYLPAALDDQAQYNLAYITAPVFNGRGTIAFILALIGFISPFSGEKVRAAGNLVRSTCDEITRSTGGRVS